MALGGVAVVEAAGEGEAEVADAEGDFDPGEEEPSGEGGEACGGRAGEEPAGEEGGAEKTEGTEPAEQGLGEGAEGEATGDRTADD